MEAAGGHAVTGSSHTNYGQTTNSISCALHKSKARRPRRGAKLDYRNKLTINAYCLRPHGRRPNNHRIEKLFARSYPSFTINSDGTCLRPHGRRPNNHRIEKLFARSYPSFTINSDGTCLRPHGRRPTIKESCHARRGTRA